MITMEMVEHSMENPSAPPATACNRCRTVFVVGMFLLTLAHTNNAIAGSAPPFFAVSIWMEIESFDQVSDYLPDPHSLSIPLAFEALVDQDSVIGQYVYSTGRFAETLVRLNPQLDSAVRLANGEYLEILIEEGVSGLAEEVVEDFAGRTPRRAFEIVGLVDHTADQLELDPENSIVAAAYEEINSRYEANEQRLIAVRSELYAASNLEAEIYDRVNSLADRLQQQSLESELDELLAPARLSHEAAIQLYDAISSQIDGIADELADIQGDIALYERALANHEHGVVSLTQSQLDAYRATVDALVEAEHRLQVSLRGEDGLLVTEERAAQLIEHHIERAEVEQRLGAISAEAEMLNDALSTVVVFVSVDFVSTPTNPASVPTANDSLVHLYFDLLQD